MSVALPDFKLDLQKDFFLIAGPCVIESREHVMFMAAELKKMTADCGVAVRLQGVVRQSQSQFHQIVSRCRASRKGLKILARSARAASVFRSLPISMRPPRRMLVAEDRRYSSDSGVSLPSDGSDCGGREDGTRSSM